MNDTFSSILLRWFATNGRQLPWRETSDAYAIWLSEIILQQTRVEQGRDYWMRFMQRFPNVATLAEASEDEVLRLWQGLGYYSRARNLHTAARQIVALGAFPQSLDGIRALKGVGDYTAAAIASFAFNIPSAAVDGNVYRVLARHFGIETPINTAEGKHLFTALANELLPPHEAGTFNQAMMDFGATLCTPKRPHCDACPFMETCVARRQNCVDSLPVKLKTTKVQERRLAYIYIRYRGETAIRRRGAGDIWQGLWEPVVVMDNGQWMMENGEWTARPEGTLDPSRMENGQSMMNEAVLLAKDVKHVLTHRIILADFYLLETSAKPSLPAEYIWIPESSLADYAQSRLIQRLLSFLPAMSI